MEEKGTPISKLQEIRDPTGEEMIPVAINGTNGYVKLKDISPTLSVEYDESEQKLTVTGISLTIKYSENQTNI